MAKYQYRISTVSNWTSNFGYSFLALQNRSGSGRKMTIRSMEVQVLTAFCDAAGTPTSSAVCGLYKASSSEVLDGEEMNRSVVAMDSTNVLPSTVKVRRNSTNFPSFSNMLHEVDVSRRGSTVGTQSTLFSMSQIGRIGKQSPRLFATSRNNNWSGLTEPIQIIQNEALALIGIPGKVSMTQPFRVELIVNIDGKTFVWNFNSVVIPGVSLFSLENLGTSVVKLVGYSFSELGTTDTPYIRMVPVGQLYASDIGDLSKNQLRIQKMDSSSPDVTTLDSYSDVGFIPFGVPEKYIADAAPAAAAPRGFNYLHTKDFDGPVYRTFLPEMCHTYRRGDLAGGDTVGHTMLQKYNDLLTRGSGITMNPGEGVALVSSAETAVGVVPAYSGWPSLIFTAVIDVEPQFSPFLILTGLQDGSEVRIIQGETELAGVEGITGGTFAWNYDPDVVTSVDIVIHALSYNYIRLQNVSLGVNGATIPIQQQKDRWFDNP